MNKIKIFNNPEFGQVRTIEKDGEPWFVLYLPAAIRKKVK
jgi:prophage antirepressor-like protein